VEELAQSTGDLPGCVLTEDLKLKKVHGDQHRHQNDGALRTTLHGKDIEKSWTPSQPNNTKLQEERQDDSSCAC
jgi:hypothetical protein